MSCGGGAIYVTTTGSIKLIDCVVENNVAYVRAPCARPYCDVECSLASRDLNHHCEFVSHHPASRGGRHIHDRVLRAGRARGGGGGGGLGGWGGGGGVNTRTLACFGIGK